ncbi:nuclear RNA export factor 1-like isoform X3 [Anoplolepis gracilipes]|uniref:nuclear RNA export factor 1-like isoform X3 n=1 Tax=Anoplolepis gracilipes TaxID=354296 RepID=UPI003B9EE891
MSKKLNKSWTIHSSFAPFKHKLIEYNYHIGKNYQEFKNIQYKKFLDKLRAQERYNPLYRHRNFREIQIGSQGLIKENNWYKISIPFGNQYTKDYVLNSLLNYIAPEVFFPIMYKIRRCPPEAYFYVDDYKTANTLLNCDRKITMVDGFKLRVRLKLEFPKLKINNKCMERLKQVMFKRYVQETNALDLSKFHQDSDLIGDYCCPLVHTSVLINLLGIMRQHIPTLEALNLESNNLCNIDILNKLTIFSKLKILHIGNNKIKNIRQINAIKDLKLEELKLTGNPVCDKYKSQNEYISDIRQRFPNLLRLDDIELAQPIVFDVIDFAKVPQSQRILFADIKAHQIACQFLHQYFTIFDNENRELLLNAYNELVYFSITITHSKELNRYLMNNRNLLRIYDKARRQKLLKYSRLSTVSFISNMPQTRHLFDTFTMDITLVTQTMMFITITGYFQELDNKEQPIRHFNRTFVIIPQGNGYCICNEQLHINQPSEAQLKQLNQQIKPKTPELLPIDTAKPIDLKLNDNMKEQMVVILSKQTNMNLEWSLKCLQDLQWNYHNALFAFQDLFKRGQIPSEAFTKVI